MFFEICLDLHKSHDWALQYFGLLSREIVHFVQTRLEFLIDHHLDFDLVLLPDIVADCFQVHRLVVLRLSFGVCDDGTP